MSRVGIYGGTFDPIHNGHLRVITELISRDIVDEIILIPAGDPQLRSNPPVASGLYRLAMCEIALADLPDQIGGGVEVSSIEIERIGPTYTIDTVTSIQKAMPQAQLLLIVGSDAYANFAKWHRMEELTKLVEIIVINRPHHPGGATLDIGALDVSATEIRSGESQLVPPSVAQYIKENGLYASQ